MNAIEFSGVTLARGPRVILRDLDIAVRQGEFIAVLGPNGAGKTSFFQSVLGLLAPRAGRIKIFGRPAGQCREVGVMPQTGGEWAAQHLSGRAFVGSSWSTAWGLPILPRAARRQVERVLSLVQAEAYAHQTMDRLSGGQRQRLMLAQAMLCAPRLLLLDEPLAGLDPHGQVETVALVKHLADQLGVTVLFSAHETSLLLPVIDRVLYFGSGQAVLGDVDTVMTAPVLSRLYGTPMEIVRDGRRIFVTPSAAFARTAAPVESDHVLV